jgi:UDPglucose--hexose-1-phosphate uridylyltransferase
VGELRKDYILDRYVIIATERAKRPHQFQQKKDAFDEKIDYFAPGNEGLTPPEIMRWPAGGDWQIRVFPNKFAAVQPKGKSDISTDNGFFTYSDSYGNHEVIVETPDAEESLADVPKERIAQLFRIFRQRIEANQDDPKVRYVSVFKNNGKDAGTSIKHSHCQLVSYNLVPEVIWQKERAVKKYASCPYCSIMEIEKGSLRRCFENDDFISFTPYASRFPLEIWVFPRRHIISLSQFTEQEFESLGDMMKKILLRLKELNADYNFFLQYGIEDMHFHIEICPRLATWAGFELSTGTIINTMTPEDAASFYRGE